MALRKKSDEEGVTLEQEDIELRLGPAKEHGKGIGGGPVEWALDLPTSHVKDSIAFAVQEYLEARRAGTDRLENFVAAATAARYLGAGAVGVVESSRHEALYEWVCELTERVALRGRRLKVMAGVGALFPVPIFDIKAAVDWLRHQDEATYARLVKDGMRSPADLFAPALRVSPHLLVATADIKDVVSSEHTAPARYIVKQHINLGCSVLLAVGDMETDALRVDQLVKGLKKFDLGKF